MIKFLIENFGRNILIILFPLILFFFSTKLLKFDSNFDFFVAVMILLSFLIISIIYFITYQTEHILDFLKKKDSKLTFILRIIFYIISFSLMFTGYYYCIYLFDNSNFLNVTNGNPVEVYCDFFYYSLGTFLINNNSVIIAQSTFAKLISASEILSSFVSIVVILANLETLKDPINDFSK